MKYYTNAIASRTLFACLAIFCFLLHHDQLHAQNNWRQLSSPTVMQLKKAFKQPSSYYSNSVTWGWNGAMSREVIARDLESLHARGFSAVTIEAGYRMPAEYLSDSWFKLIRIAVEEAKKRDMHIWIIDEGKYPSGFAGGKFSKERPDLRMQGLVVYERINVSPWQTVSKKLSAPFVSAVALNLTDSSSQVIAVRSGEINWTAAKDNWQILLVQPQFKTAVTRASNNPTGGKDTTNALCDYLNPVAVKQFIDFTHEQYKKYIGDEFGKTVLGFRGDEPDFAYIPWTPKMLTEFQQRKGYDIQPYLASFFLKNSTDEQRRAKADYWDVWSDLFGETFFKLQADWCSANNLEYMVHLNHDDAMIGLVKSEGDFFKDFRTVQIPGIDVIWHQIWPGLVADFPKFASSAAHLFGRPRAFSESFAAFDPAPDIVQARWILNHQLVRGINLFEFMFFNSTSENKGGARGYMADKLFPSLMTYVNRSSFLLAQGVPAANIAVYFPTTSLWLGYNESENSSFRLAQQLLTSQHDFDFIDEFSLTTLSRLNKNVFVNKSGQEYKTIIVPSIKALSKAAYNRLKEFVHSGGKVIFIGELPSIINDNNFLKAEASLNFDWVMQKSDSSMNAISSLPSDIILDQPCASLTYLHRRWNDADMFFFFNESDAPLSRKITFGSKGKVEEWNAENGTVYTVKAAIGKNDLAQLDLEFKPYETKFIVIGNYK